MPSRDETPSPERTIAAFVKRQELDFYWSTLFAPVECRADLLALYGFHAELDRIPALVSDAMVGQLRLKWWRDVVEFAEPGRNTGRATADAFARLIVTRDLDKERLLTMVDARLADIYKEPPADWASLDVYYHEIWGTVFATAALILGAKPHELDPVLPFASLAFGLTRSLQAFAHDFGQGRAAFPLAIFEQHGVTPETLALPETAASLKAALAEVSDRASTAYDAFRLQARRLPRRLLPPFLPLVQVPAILRKIARADFNPLEDTVRLNPFSRFGRLWMAALQGSI